MSALGGAAVSGATLDALTRVNALLRSEEYRRHRAVHLLQLAARKNTILRRHRTAATPTRMTSSRCERSRLYTRYIYTRAIIAD